MQVSLALLRRLVGDSRGAFAIETAIVAPVLLVMSLGAFQVSAMVARQSELQGAAAEAAAIAIASAPDTQAKLDTLKSIIVTSTELPTNKVTVAFAHRCGANANYVTDSATCGGGDIATYVRIDLSDTYTPVWTEFGVGRPLTYSVTRYVMTRQWK